MRCNTVVYYNRGRFCAVVVDHTGREYQFEFYPDSGRWYVCERWYANAEFHRG